MTGPFEELPATVQNCYVDMTPWWVQRPTYPPMQSIIINTGNVYTQTPYEQICMKYIEALEENRSLRQQLDELKAEKNGL